MEKIALTDFLPEIPGTIEQDRVLVWRCPSDISQSRIGGRSSPSNACTLIALRMAATLHARDIRFAFPFIPQLQRIDKPPVLSTSSRGNRVAAGAERRDQITNCPLNLLSAFVESMIDGNRLHEKAVEGRAHADINFTIPDANTALGEPFKEIDYNSFRGEFAVQLHRAVRMAIRSPVFALHLRLCLVVIALERTILLSFDRNNRHLLLVDPHLHSADGSITGGVLAVSSIDDLGVFSKWIAHNIFPEVLKKEMMPKLQDHQEFEISILHYAAPAQDMDCPTRLLPPPRPQFIFNFDKENIPPPKKRKYEEVDDKYSGEKDAASEGRLPGDKDNMSGSITRLLNDENEEIIPKRCLCFPGVASARHPRESYFDSSPTFVDDFPGTIGSFVEVDGDDLSS